MTIQGFDFPEHRRPLSPKQDEVLRALVLWIARRRSQPSMKELAAAVGVSTVQKYLLELEVKGWIKSTGSPRAIEIPSDVYDSIVGPNF
jgi:SOS-response transcriptional repressor LexA